jgi:glutamate-1-semialdehyde 2,1-aminomutase
MQLFEKDVFFFTTFGGEALSLAAAIATISEMKEKNVAAALDKKGAILKDGYNQIAEELGIASYTRCSGYNCRSMITFDASAGDPLLLKSFVQQEMIKRGILWAGFHNLCFTHTDSDLDYTLKAYREVLPMLKKAMQENTVAASLLGEPLETVFRKVDNYNIKPKTTVVKS